MANHIKSVLKRSKSTRAFPGTKYKFRNTKTKGPKVSSVKHPRFPLGSKLRLK